jgi:hypothetical protein
MSRILEFPGDLGRPADGLKEGRFSSLPGGHITEDQPDSTSLDELLEVCRQRQLDHLRILVHSGRDLSEYSLGFIVAVPIYVSYYGWKGMDLQHKSEVNTFGVCPFSKNDVNYLNPLLKTPHGTIWDLLDRKARRLADKCAEEIKQPDFEVSLFVTFHPYDTTDREAYTGVSSR